MITSLLRASTEITHYSLIHLLFHLICRRLFHLLFWIIYVFNILLASSSILVEKFFAKDMISDKIYHLLIILEKIISIYFNIIELSLSKVSYIHCRIKAFSHSSNINKLFSHLSFNHIFFQLYSSFIILPQSPARYSYI